VKDERGRVKVEFFEWVKSLCASYASPHPEKQRRRSDDEDDEEIDEQIAIDMIWRPSPSN
jgi:hypothetical protein